MRDQLPRRLRVLHVGEEHHHRAPAYAERQVSHCVPEIRLDELWLDRVQRLGDPPQLGRPALRLEEIGDAIVECHQADPVAESLRHPGEHQSGVDGVVELVQVARRRGHQAPAVEGDDHLLSALGLDLDDHRPVAPRGRCPADAAHVVAAHVLAQARECRRGARGPRASHARHRAQAPTQRELDAPDRDHVGKDSRVFSVRKADLAPPPAVPPPDLQVDGVKDIRAALRRARAVGRPQHAGRVEPAPHFARRRAQQVGSVVGDPGHEARRRAVLDDDRHLFRLAQGKGLGHDTPNAIPLAARQQREVARGDDHQPRVVDDRDEGEQRRDGRERDEPGTETDRPDQPWLRREPSSPPCGEVGHPAQPAGREGLVQRGGTTRPATTSSTLSGVWPATSASGRRIKR